MRTNEEYLKVISYYKRGLNNVEIAKLTKIPRTTINQWIKRGKKNKNVFNPYEYIVNNKLQKTYSYILGLYLGDGCIDKMERTYRLRIFNTVKYSELNNYIINQLKCLLPENSVSVINKVTYLEIAIYSNKLISLFPQHGVGRKHLRKIELTEWQKETIIPKYIIMGLFHSDGTYYIRKSRNYSSYSYGFRNESLDIHKIFQSYCDKIKIHTTFNKKLKKTDIYTKEAVEKLYNLIGDKMNIVYD